MSFAAYRPIAYVAVADPGCRSRIIDALVRQRWTVEEQPTGFHLLDAIADVIEGHETPLPGLLVVDAVSRGCAGITIAAGLRQLGVRIPLVLVAKHGDPVIELDDPSVRVVGPNHAVAAVAELARPLAGHELTHSDCGVATRGA
jgi:hypothetical protein